MAGADGVASVEIALDDPSGPGRDRPGRLGAPGSAGLLDDVHQLVGGDPIPARPGPVSEEDVAVEGEGICADSAVQKGRLRAGVNPDVTQIDPELRLHEFPSPGIQRCPRFGESGSRGGYRSGSGGLPGSPIVFHARMGDTRSVVGFLLERVSGNAELDLGPNRGPGNRLA